MKYTISEIASLLGVTTHNLRYYEKIGIIKPNVNEETGYRTYSVLDTRRFNLARFYRGFDFTLDEVKEMLVEEDIHDYLDSKEEELEKEMILMKLKLESMKRYKWLLSILDEGIDKSHIVEMDDYIRIEIFDNEKIRSDEKTVRLRDELLKHEALVKWVSRIPREVLDKQEDHHYHYGLNMKLDDAISLGINVGEYEIIPKGRYCVTFFRKESREPFTGNNIVNAMNALQEYRIVNYGSGYSNCLKSIKEKDKYHNYHYFLIKIIE